MSLDDLLNPIVEFFSTGIGAAIAEFARLAFDFLFPPNAEAARPV